MRSTGDVPYRPTVYCPNMHGRLRSSTGRSCFRVPHSTEAGVYRTSDESAVFRRSQMLPPLFNRHLGMRSANQSLCSRTM
jgi:hypothetical protein